MGARTGFRGRRAISRGDQGTVTGRGQAEISEMVWQLPLPVHERFFALGPCVHYLENRIRGWLPEDAGQARFVPPWVPLYWYAYQGA